MSEKTFLVKMDDEYRCRCYAALDMECLNSEDGICCPSRGNLKKRPEWCPLIEHSIGECHIKYKELSNREEKDLESVATEAAKRIWPDELRSKVLLGLDEYDF